MSKIFHIFHLPVLLLMMAAVLLTACSSDSPEAQTISAGDASKGHVVNLVSYASCYAETQSSHRAAPLGYIDYPLDKVVEMGIYMYSEDPTALVEKLIKYDGAKWHAYFDVEKNKQYTVYGYLPKLEGVTSTLTKSTADAAAATLTIYGMKPITTDDICIITGVKETETGLKEGSFSWFKAVTDNEYIYMLLNHLYASVSFNIKVDAEYAKLRTIKLKSMKLNTNIAGVNAEITLTHNTTGEVPMDVNFTPTGSSSEVVIFSSTEGEALNATVTKEFNTCFAPSLSNQLTLTSTYDVCDKEGNLIRKGCTATNKIPDLEASRGQRVQLNLTVNPSYLYVLSDPDLDNPTVKIN